MSKKAELNICEIIEEYKSCGNLHKMAKKFHTSHIRLAELLRNNGIAINEIGKKKTFSDECIKNMINDYKINLLTTKNIAKKYSIRLKRLKEIFKERGVVISKWNGHIREEKIKKITDKKEKLIKPTKECPYCGWKTIDIENKSNAYSNHLIHKHGIDVIEHLKKYPQDEFYLKNVLVKMGKVKCEICGKYLHLIDNRHLVKHGITKQEYIGIYGNSLISENTKFKLHNCINKMHENKDWERYSSSYENEIKNFLSENNVNFEEHNRSVLNGLEIDILTDKNIGIEFNGNKFHTEWFGRKNKYYHLNKTLICNSKGIKLMQIFEDEYKFHKDLIYDRISYAIGLKANLPKIMARKCKINEISENGAKKFFSIYDIKDFKPSSVYLGCFYGMDLIAVMSFIKRRMYGDKWIMTNFISNCNYICQGVGGKLFKGFVRKYNPSEVESFADRRYTLDSNNNVYTKIGFVLDKELKPNYRYYNEHVDKFKRFHKCNFKKNILSKKYAFPTSMTETEMVKELGYDRIWDCGTFKYVWRN